MVNKCPDCQSALVLERASGYMGFRCTKCGQWFYADQHTNKPLKIPEKTENTIVGWYIDPNELTIRPLGKIERMSVPNPHNTHVDDPGYQTKIWWYTWRGLTDLPAVVHYECVCNDLMAAVTILENNYKLVCPQNRFQPTG